jgi:divalent metal cation (Fe/Co/Zn/Cd) transporter
MVNGILTLHLAPDQIVAASRLEFADRLTTPDIEMTVARLEQSIKQRHSEVISLFVKPQTPGSYRRVAGANLRL